MVSEDLLEGCKYLKIFNFLLDDDQIQPDLNAAAAESHEVEIRQIGINSFLNLKMIHLILFFFYRRRS
jgi:hypothetical protein